MNGFWNDLFAYKYNYIGASTDDPKILKLEKGKKNVQLKLDTICKLKKKLRIYGKIFHATLPLLEDINKNNKKKTSKIHDMTKYIFCFQ